MGFVTLNSGSVKANEDFIRILVALKLDTVSCVFTYSGQGYWRTHGKHDNFHLTGDVDGRAYDLFMKRHRGWGAKEALKLLMARSPLMSPGRREWENILHLEGMGIPTMRPVAFGDKKAGFLGRRSFIVTERIPNAAPMDDFLKERYNRPLAGPELREKRSLLRDAGDLVRRLHGAGFTHMDLYLNHIFVRETPEGGKILHLIDLQRVAKRWLFKRRWIIKDLSALLYSMRDLPLSRTDVARLFTGYFDGSIDLGDERLMRAAIKRCRHMMARDGG